MGKISGLARLLAGRREMSDSREMGGGEREGEIFRINMMIYYIDNRNEDTKERDKKQVQERV